MAAPVVGAFIASTQDMSFRMHPIEMTSHLGNFVSGFRGNIGWFFSFIIFVLLINPAYGNESVLPDKIEEIVDANYFIQLDYSPLDLLIINKFGFTVGITQNKTKTWEFEYLKSSLSAPFLIEDLGNMKDERYSLIARSFSEKSSLNFSYGISYFDFSVHLGNKFLSSSSGANDPSIDLIKIQALGANFGIGNQWHFKHNIVLGLDWISWSQPLVITQKQSTFLDYSGNEEYRHEVFSALKLVSYFPRLSFLKIKFGMEF